VLSAAERNGALLVSLENVYDYGPTAGYYERCDTQISGPEPKRLP
jgi:hypothetical protein